MSMIDKDTKWLLASIIAIIIIVSIGVNYKNFNSFDFNNIFNIKTYPKDEKPKESDFDKLFNPKKTNQ
jgi:hypothetical protein